MATGKSLQYFFQNNWTINVSRTECTFWLVPGHQKNLPKTFRCSPASVLLTCFWILTFNFSCNAVLSESCRGRSASVPEFPALKQTSTLRVISALPFFFPPLVFAVIIFDNWRLCFHQRLFAFLDCLTVNRMPKKVMNELYCIFFFPFV